MLHSLILSFILSVPTTKVEGNIVVMTEVEYASASDYKELHQTLYMDVAFPSVSSEPLPAVIFLHGGGWSGGSRSEGVRFIRMLASGGYFACSIDYRLTQTAGFPASIHDSKEAIRFLRSNAEELGIDSKRIGIAGYSSGGHLATLVGLTTEDEFVGGTTLQKKHKNESAEVRCIATVSGMVMPHLSRGRGKQKYEDWALQTKGITIEETLPQTYADAHDPPIYLLCGSDDHVAPVKYTQQFVEILLDKGIEVQIEILPKRGHIITTAESYFGLLRFLDKHLGGHSEEAVRKYAEMNKKSGGGRK